MEDLNETHFIFTRTDGVPYNYNVDDPTSFALGPIRKMNIFIGPNNSGKSRLLRYLFTAIEKGISQYESNTSFFGEKQEEYSFEDISPSCFSKKSLLVEINDYLTRLHKFFDGLPMVIAKLEALQRSVDEQMSMSLREYLSIRESRAFYSIVWNGTTPEVIDKILLEEIKQQALGQQDASDLRREAKGHLTGAIKEFEERMGIKPNSYFELVATYIPALRTLKDIGAYKEVEEKLKDTSSSGDITMYKHISGSSDVGTPKSPPYAHCIPG